MEDTLEREVSVRYERDNSVNYAVIDAKEGWECEDDYEVKMLMFNMPEHFLTITMNEIDGRSCIYYDISSKQQLSRLFEYGKVTMEDVKTMFNNISEMVRVVDEYMLDLDRVILKPQHIYVSLANKKYSFMYSPIASNSDFYDNMRALFEYILERFDHSVEKTSIVRFYEIYQRILVRDYTPHNLMSFFENEEKTHIDIEDNTDKEDELQTKKMSYNNNDNNNSGNTYTNDDKYIGKKYHNTYQSESGKTNRIKSENKPGDYGNDRSRKDSTYKADENGQYNGKIIKDVMPEIVDDNKQNKSNKKISFVMKTVAIVILLNAFLSMFYRTYAVVKMNTAASVICIIAGLLIFYVSGKIADIIGEITSADKVTEDELMPYRMHSDTGKFNENINDTNDKRSDIINNKKDSKSNGIRETENNGFENSYKKTDICNDYRNSVKGKKEDEYDYEYTKNTENSSYSNIITARVMKDEEEQETRINHTMLLSDYLKMLKDNKLTLSLLDNKDNLLYLKTGDAYEQPSEGVEPVKYPCTIGSLEGSADIFIDSPVISKMHACLLQEDDKFYIEDMNSTNGTYINDERIAMHSKTRIADGDILRVAAYNFKVCIS